MVGTPGRILALVRNKKLNLKHLKHFILDECDKMLELLGKYCLIHLIIFNIEKQNIKNDVLSLHEPKDDDKHFLPPTTDLIFYYQ